MSQLVVVYGAPVRGRVGRESRQNGAPVRDREWAYGAPVRGVGSGQMVPL
jgi:hypothetical protein